MLRTLALVVLVVFTSNLVADEKTDKVLKDLQGDWKVEKLVSGGNEVAAKDTDKLVFTIKDKTIFLNVDKDDVANFKINIEKKPGWFDITDKAKKEELGIFELSGDTLKICSAPDGDRPKDFVSTKENKAILFVLKRVKK